MVQFSRSRGVASFSAKDNLVEFCSENKFLTIQWQPLFSTPLPEARNRKVIVFFPRFILESLSCLPHPSPHPLRSLSLKGQGGAEFCLSTECKSVSGYSESVSRWTRVTVVRTSRGGCLCFLCPPLPTHVTTPA